MKPTHPALARRSFLLSSTLGAGTALSGGLLPALLQALTMKSVGKRSLVCERGMPIRNNQLRNRPSVATQEKSGAVTRSTG